MKNKTNKWLLRMIPCLALVLWSGVGNVCASSKCEEIIDPVGDFLDTYAFPHVGDLDVVSAQVTLFTGSEEFLFSGTMDAPIETPEAFYVWGVNRGAKTESFERLGLPDIVVDLVVVVRPGGDSVVNDLDAEIVTPLPPENISIDGNTVTARVPLSLLPPRGLQPEEYTWNLWPRWDDGMGLSDPQISDFAPDDHNAPVCVVQ